MDDLEREKKIDLDLKTAWDNLDQAWNEYFQNDKEDTDEDKKKVVCPECLKEVTQEELDMFGGVCEDCCLIN